MLLMLSGRRKQPGIIVPLLCASHCMRNYGYFFDAHHRSLRQKHFYLSCTDGNSLRDVK